MKVKLASLTLVFVAILVGALWLLKPMVPPRIDEITAGKLVHEADEIYSGSCRLNSRRWELVEPKSWTTEVTKLKPISVRVDNNGVYVVLEKNYVEERGLFLLPSSSLYVPNLHTDPGYLRVEGRVFWYVVKG